MTFLSPPNYGLFPLDSSDMFDYSESGRGISRKISKTHNYTEKSDLSHQKPKKSVKSADIYPMRVIGKVIVLRMIVLNDEL